MTWTDNTPLDPLRDLERYDIYASDNGAFLDDDLIASVGYMDNGVNLSLLRPLGFHGGKWLSVRSVALDNSNSPYAEPVWWESEGE